MTAATPHARTAVEPCRLRVDPSEKRACDVTEDRRCCGSGAKTAPDRAVRDRRRLGDRRGGRSRGTGRRPRARRS
ncbi:hypothetical protein EAO73_34910, partial [Streptomyces sp. col6]